MRAMRDMRAAQVDILTLGQYLRPTLNHLAVERWVTPAEFERFVSDVLSLRAGREAPRLSATEADLLRRINLGLPDDLRARHDALIDRRRAESLTPAEQDELLALTDQVEAREAERLSALSELARHRGVSLSTLMADLGLPAPTHG